MSEGATAVALAAIIDSLALMQGQLDRIERGNGRIEAAQRDILGRLDTIDAGQAAVTDLLPVLEMILARSIEDREITRGHFGTVAAVAAFALSAVNGGQASLPVDLADDPLLERFALSQPADRVSAERALVEWRRVAAAASSDELIALLQAQYRPSPTDSPATRVLRYRLAAITRAELEGRGVTPPAPPSTTIHPRASRLERDSRSMELATLWRAGESKALFAESELAGALDLFARAEKECGSLADDRLEAVLADLHRDLGDRLADGDRPAYVEERTDNSREQMLGRSADMEK